MNIPPETTLLYHARLLEDQSEKIAFMRIQLHQLIANVNLLMDEYNNLMDFTKDGDPLKGIVIAKNTSANLRLVD